ncbi:hypothetical protein QJS04_geneDACA021820 [Acorus gramineus]|uniref:Uncharacterized protein n=1 Tax=Acorus gramineus TaxID=55184 RepID=A0AAV8ZZK6_ACOGR|nr:hypothetical protein QJS04_geneDACA021820 [Acorus gramineus]
MITQPHSGFLLFWQTEEGRLCSEFSRWIYTATRWSRRCDIRLQNSSSRSSCCHSVCWYATTFYRCCSRRRRATLE